MGHIIDAKIFEINGIALCAEWTIANPRKSPRFKASRMQTHLEKLIPFLKDKSKKVREKAEEFFDRFVEEYLAFEINGFYE